MRIDPLPFRRAVGRPATASPFLCGDCEAMRPLGSSGITKITVHDSSEATTSFGVEFPGSTSNCFVDGRFGAFATGLLKKAWLRVSLCYAKERVSARPGCENQLRQPDTGGHCGHRSLLPLGSSSPGAESPRHLGLDRLAVGSVVAAGVTRHLIEGILFLARGKRSNDLRPLGLALAAPELPLR